MPRMNRKPPYSYHGVTEGETEDAQRIRFQFSHNEYWKEPDYSKFLKYPMCLYYLDLLQHENFRKEVVNTQCCKFIDDQMILHWQHYTRKRMKLMETGITQQGSQTPSSQSMTPAPSPAPNMINGFSQKV